MQVTSLQSQPATVFLCQKNHFAFNQDEASIPLCSYTARYLWVSVFLPKVPEPEDSPGRQIQESSGFTALQIGGYAICLPSFPWFLLQPACSLHGCSLALSSCLLNRLHSGVLPGSAALFPFSLWPAAEPA